MTAPASTPPGAPTLEQLQQLKRVREAALLRKWTAGRALSPDEMSEIAHVLPPAILAKPPPPKARYLHDYAHYAAQLGYDVRNIKRFVQLGKIARLLPPFDEPTQLADWWERMKLLGHLKQQVPQRILELVARQQQPLAAADLPAAPTPAGTPPVPPPPSTNPATTRVNYADVEAIGLSGAVHELSMQLAVAQAQLREAREKGMDDVVIGRRQKNFETTLDSLRKTESALQKLQAERGDLAPVASFRGDLVTLATTLRGMMRRRADNVCKIVAPLLTPEHLAAVRAAIETEGQREQALFRRCQHWPRDLASHEG